MKIGATLANSNQSADAIPYYSEALAIRPKYARGWLNLGISHANLNQYSEAAKAYLQALQFNPSARYVTNPQTNFLFPFIFYLIIQR